MPATRMDGTTPVPSRIGAYEIVRPLARGGMAAVYLVRKLGPGGFERHAAMKLVRPEHAADPRFRAMFLDEGRLAARIMHSNVIHIEELGEHEGMLYLVMEYVPGVALSSLLRRLEQTHRGLHVTMAVALLARIASGLHAAHETRDGKGRLLNVVHRDVSPQNVLIGANGAVKLIDFGIASARNRLYQTNRELVRGKLHYMSPEQLQGERLDRRADLFSLGVVLWELLTHTRLFRGQDDAQVIRAIVRGELPPPGAFGDVPHTLDRLVMKMLAGDPEQRPATAREVRAELKRWVPEAFAIDDEEIASMLIGACAEELSGLPDVATARPLNTAELSVRPGEALERFTHPVDRTDARATVLGSSAVRASPRALQTETLDHPTPSLDQSLDHPTPSLDHPKPHESHATREASSERTRIGVPGAPSRVMEMASVSSPEISSPDMAAIAPSPVPRGPSTEDVPTVERAPAFPRTSRPSFPRVSEPTEESRSIPVWAWVALATLAGGGVGLAAWLLAG